MVNFDELNTKTHQVVTSVQIYNEEGTEVTTEEAKYDIKIPLRKNPNNSSEVLSELSFGAPIVMQREWVTGNSNWAFVKDQQTGIEGYILTKYLKPTVEWELNNLPKANVEITKMTEIAKALIPAFYELESPYYHKENGEWWVPVTLNKTCIEENTISELDYEAKFTATLVLYNYLSIPTESAFNSNFPNVQEFTQAFLNSHVEDYYLSTRPGSKLKMLVAIPAVYVQYIVNQMSEESTGSIDEELCMKMPIGSIESMASDTRECLEKMYQQYLDSNLYTADFNFEQEILKQINGISALKLLLKLNNISYNTPLSQRNKDFNPCENGPESLKVCFNQNYTLKTVIHIDTSGNEKVLSQGLSSMRNSYPWNDSGYGLIFFKQTDLCESIMNPGSSPTVQQFFNEYTVETKQGAVVSSKKVAPIDYGKGQTKAVGDFGKQELGMALTTVSVLQGVASSLNMVLGLEEGSDPICFDSSKECAEFKKRAIQDRDSKHIMAGDFLSNFKFICDFDYQNADEEGMHDQVTRHIGGFPDWVFGLFGLGDMDVGNFPAGTFDWDLTFPELSAIRLPTLDPLGAIKEVTFKKLLEFVEDIVFKIVGFVLKLLCDLLLTILINSLLVGLGILAAYGLYLLLKDDDEGSDPHPSILAMKNYGAEDANEVFKESFGVSDEAVYDIKVGQMFDECGVDMTPQESKAYLSAISEVVSPIEMLSLFSGKSTLALLNEVLQYTQSNFPKVYEKKDTQSKLASFFSCIGTNITPRVTQRIENDIAAQYQDPDLCASIAEELKDIMKKKCPNPEIYNSIYEKEFKSDADKYRNVVNLLQDECNNLVPNFFNNLETGEKGLISSANLQPTNLESTLDALAETVIGSSKGFLAGESANYFAKYGNSFKDFVGLQSGEGVLLQKDLIQSNASGRNYNYNFSSYPFPNLPSGQSVPNYTLNKDGSESIDFIYYKSKQLSSIEKSSILGDTPSSMVNLLESYESSHMSDNKSSDVKISLQQRLFYSLMQNYFINNSKGENNNGVAIGSNFPLPYNGLNFQKPYDATYTDEMYRMIFSQLLERVARKPGFEWSGKDPELEAYSSSLQKYSLNILDYDKSKKEMLRYYDLADYDDPNDNTEIGSKQYAMLHGVLYFYSRVYILEYLARAMPYYVIFDYPKDYYNFSEVSVDYIVQMIEQDFGYPKFDNYNPIFNDVFDYVRIKSEIEITGFSGFYRGLKYYVTQNFNDVYELFNQYMPLGVSELGGGLEKKRYDLEKGIFIAAEPSQTEDEKNATIISLDVHSYAGQPTIDPDGETGQVLNQDQTGQWQMLLEAGYNFNTGDWKEKDTIVDFSDENYSLFGSKYKYFKNGMFFIQNYISYDVGQATLDSGTAISIFNLINARNNLKGFVNKKSLSDINSYLNQGGTLNDIPYNQLEMSQLFVEGSVKAGSRLCYGIAYDPSDNSADPEVQLFAQKMFKNYTNNNSISSDVYKDASSANAKKQLAVEMASLNKYLICVDGPSAKFSAEGDNSYLNYSIGGTFSIVLPIFNREMDITLNQKWSNFAQDYSYGSTSAGFADKSLFKNLNQDLLNSDEYFTLKNNCFSLKNMLHFNAFSGLAYYGNNKELDKGFGQTKIVLNSSIDTIINGAKNSDYNYQSAINATGETY